MLQLWAGGRRVFRGLALTKGIQVEPHTLIAAVHEHKDALHSRKWYRVTWLHCEGIDCGYLLSVGVKLHVASQHQPAALDFCCIDLLH